MVRASENSRVQVPPLKVHGGKWYTADWIISLMPPHQHYLEPFYGGGSVLLRKDPTNTSEIVCDLDLDLSNFWTVLQNRPLFDAFHRAVSVIPFSEMEYGAAVELLKGTPPHIGFTMATGVNDERAATSIARAVAFFVMARQSLAGRQECFSPVTTGRLRRGMNEQVSAWLGCVEALPAVAERMLRVLILKPQKAQGLVKKFDKPDLLQYWDPPYHPETRESREVYRHEMTAQEHEELLKVALTIEHAQVMISGYRHPLYDELLRDWTRHELVIDNKSSSRKEKPTKMECLWVNY